MRLLIIIKYFIINWLNQYLNSHYDLITVKRSQLDRIEDKLNKFIEQYEIDQL